MLCYLTKVGKSQCQSTIREVVKRKFSVCFGGKKEINSDGIFNEKTTQNEWLKNDCFYENNSFKYGLFI